MTRLHLGSARGQWASREQVGEPGFATAASSLCAAKREGLALVSTCAYLHSLIPCVSLDPQPICCTREGLFQPVRARQGAGRQEGQQGQDEEELHGSGRHLAEIHAEPRGSTEGFPEELLVSRARHGMCLQQPTSNFIGKPSLPAAVRPTTLPLIGKCALHRAAQGVDRSEATLDYRRTQAHVASGGTVAEQHFWR